MLEGSQVKSAKRAVCTNGAENLGLGGKCNVEHLSVMRYKLRFGRAGLKDVNNGSGDLEL